MTLNSTSIHNINADYSLNSFETFLYRFLNYFNNQFPYFQVDQNLKIEQFNIENLELYWHKSARKNSPSRKLSDLLRKELRNSNEKEYNQKLFTSIEEDMKTKQKEPAFYALVIHSNRKHKLF